MKFQISGHVILYGYEMSPGQFSSKKRTNYDFFGYVKDWPKAVTYSIHNLASKIGNFGLKFVYFFGFLILDGVSYSIQN